MAKTVKRGKTPATEEEDNNGTLVDDIEGDDNMFAQFGNGGGDESGPPPNLDEMSVNNEQAILQRLARLVVMASKQLIIQITMLAN